MQSTQSLQETDRHSAVLIDPAVVLAARADRPVPPAATQASAPIPVVDPVSPPHELELRNKLGGRGQFTTWVVRTGLAIVFAVCSAVAAAGWQTYGDQAQEMIGHWMPRVALLMGRDKETAPAQTAMVAQPVVNADQASSAPAQSAEAAATQDSNQLLQSMAHDLAAMGQQIADLKASIAQLKANQEQMAQQVTRAAESKPAERLAEAKPFDPKAIEQTLRPRHAPRPAPVTPAVAAAPPVHKPRPVYPSAQTVAAPSFVAPAPTSAPIPPPVATPQASADPGVETVVRPPMPVR